MPLSTPPTPAPGAPVCLARLSCSWGLGLLPWLCDGTVGVRGPFNSSKHSCVRVCALVRHHVRTVSVLGWGPMAAQTPLFWKEQPGKTPPSTHPVSICSCHSPLDSLFIGYVLVSSLPLWLILIHLIYRGGRQKATKNVLELFFLGDTASLGPWVLLRWKCPEMHPRFWWPKCRQASCQTDAQCFSAIRSGEGLMFAVSLTRPPCLRSPCSTCCAAAVGSPRCGTLWGGLQL